MFNGRAVLSYVLQFAPVELVERGLVSIGLSKAQPRPFLN